jgi:hypothetical protein
VALVAALPCANCCIHNTYEGLPHPFGLLAGAWKWPRMASVEAYRPQASRELEWTTVVATIERKQSCRCEYPAMTVPAPPTVIWRIPWMSPNPASGLVSSAASSKLAANLRFNTANIKQSFGSSGSHSLPASKSTTSVWKPWCHGTFGDWAQILEPGGNLRCLTGLPPKSASRAQPQKSANYSSTTRFRSVPTPSTVISIVSPATTGPTPSGVPVAITSPGSRVMTSQM